MERGHVLKNLEALTEEAEEDIQQLSENEEYDSDEYDPRMEEPNKFDGICDGVQTALSLVHGAMEELVNLKDELLQQSLPPSFLARLALITGKVFRSVSDLNMPSNELIRLVRLYSTPWEEKSAALKKLHEDYEIKQRQLNIAIKRLQLVDAHSKRIAHEKRIMNWEKLFAKLTSAKGHGRRWKFLIETIKQKAKLGLEHVQEYTRALEESSSEESDDEEDEIIQKEAVSKHGETDEDQANEKDSDEDSDSDDDNRMPNILIHIGDMESPGSRSSASRSSSAKKVRFENNANAYIRPPMRENSTWTEEPEYDRLLHLRVFTPEGITQTDLRCVLSYGNQLHKTEILDPLIEEPEPEEKVPSPTIQKRPRGLIGTRAPAQQDKAEETSDAKPERAKRHEDFVFALPDEEPSGSRTQPENEDHNIRIALHYGENEEMVAMATIDMDDLNSLELDVIDEDAPVGDDPMLQTPRSDDDSIAYDDVSEDMVISLQDDDDKRLPAAHDPFTDLNILPFPLYALQVGRGAAAHKPFGSLPMMLCWGRRARPRKLHRLTETMSVIDLVYDLTGIDLNVTTKADLHKETRDEALSAVSFTPELKEETITKSQYNLLIAKHDEELQLLQEEYESRLQEVIENLENLQNLREEEARNPPRSAGNRRSVVAGPDPERESVYIPAPKTSSTVKGPRPPNEKKPRKRYRVSKSLPRWGENLPEDFLERLEMLTEESNRHRQEYSEKTMREIRETLERKLAGQHKLSRQEEKIYDALKDVNLPALFMPFQNGNIFNPRAHQYFHATGSSDLRLTQPPSMFQLPPLSKNKMSVLNLFDLSRTFQTPAPSWLMNRYIEQQKPKSPHGLSPITTEATMTGPPINTPYNTPYLTSTSDVGIHQDENLVQNIPNMSQSMQANAGSSPREQEA